MSTTNEMCEMTIGFLQSRNVQVENYFAFLRESCREHPPIHSMDWYGTLYRALALEPIWMINSLIMNSEREGFGSRRIWEFAQLVPDDHMADLVRGHSIDESRHSKMFIRLIQYVFPGVLNEEILERFKDFSPGYTRRRHPELKAGNSERQLSMEASIDEIIQINFVEIRSLVLQLLLRNVALAYCPDATRPKALRILDALLSDEISHIAYSARCIEQSVESGLKDFVREKMVMRQCDLNIITCEELEEGEYNFCQECTETCQRIRRGASMASALEHPDSDAYNGAMP